MPFIQKILREVHCPRCNAIAQERLEDRDQTVIIILTCDKCKLKKYVGTTTRKALRLRKRQAKLRDLANQERNRRTRALILKRADELESEIRKAELGI